MSWLGEAIVEAALQDAVGVLNIVYGRVNESGNDGIIAAASDEKAGTAEIGEWLARIGTQSRPAHFTGGQDAVILFRRQAELFKPFFVAACALARVGQHQHALSGRLQPCNAVPR